ncbi:MAG TPA: ribonuclease H-like domain-containing protein [Candidatus Thermoplasmatota archaeon]|nr:ribonuclease H-like domain-containing protein [Candidatus Thermoplasmatota archaeon]
MLRSTFLLLPRIGPVTEARLWDAGCATWDDYRAGPPRVRGLGTTLRRRHETVLRQAEASLADDPGFFARELPHGEHWRAWGELGREAVLLDIETTGHHGSDADTLTVVGVRRAGRTRQFVLGDDLTSENLDWAFEGATMLVSFAGGSFDLPRLREAGVRIPRVPHFDLLPALQRLGHRGGLKKVEAALGIERPEGVRGMNGYDAVLLWHRHLRGDPAALDRLLAYNRADVDNLEPLARRAYDGLAAKCRDGAQRRLVPEALAAAVHAR